MQIMNTWSDDSYTSNLNQGATPTYNLGDQFDEFCAMAFIAGPPDGADKEENRIRYNLLNDRNKEREYLLKANLAAKPNEGEEASPDKEATKRKQPRDSPKQPLRGLPSIFSALFFFLFARAAFNFTR